MMAILLFNLTDQLVWTKAVKDTLGLESFYASNKENYKWKKRADAVIYSTLNKTIADQLIKRISEGEDEDLVLKELNKAYQLNVKREMKKYEEGENDFLNKVEWKQGFSKQIEIDGRVYFANIKEIIEPTYKTLDDSRGLITSNYQEFLEKEWVKELRAKAKFEVNSKMLSKLKSSLK